MKSITPFSSEKCLMFQRNILPAVSGSKSKARKKPVRKRWQAGLLFNPADGSSSVCL
jgi:hypothetical protein